MPDPSHVHLSNLHVQRQRSTWCTVSASKVSARTGAEKREDTFSSIVSPVLPQDKCAFEELFNIAAYEHLTL